MMVYDGILLPIGLRPDHEVVWTFMKFKICLYF